MNRRAAVAAAAVVLLVPAAAASFSYGEKLVAGLLPDYRQPPFGQVAQLNANITCCSPGIPADWPAANSSAHAIALKIVSLQPTIYDAEDNSTLANQTGTAEVFILAGGKTPSTLWNPADCNTQVTRTDSRETFNASLTNGITRLPIAASEYTDNSPQAASPDEEWPAQLPEKNQTAANYTGLPAGGWNFTASYAISTDYTILHYRKVRHVTCYYGGCYAWYSCNPSYTDTASYTDSATDATPITILPRQPANATLFQDGAPNLLRVVLQAPEGESWTIDTDNASISGWTAAYGFEQILPPYNFSRAVAVPRPQVTMTGLQVLRGTVQADTANALLELPDNTTGGTITITTPFGEQYIINQSPPALEGALNASGQMLPNGTGALQLNFYAGGVPLSGQPLQVQWLGTADSITTDGNGNAYDYRANASGSLATVTYDSTGQYASQQAIVPFDAPRSNAADEEDALFFIGGVALLAAGACMATGRKPQAIMPQLSNAIAWGLLIWIIARTISQ